VTDARAFGWLPDPRGPADPHGLVGMLAASPLDPSPITVASHMHERIERGIDQLAINSCPGVSGVHLSELGRVLYGLPSPRLSALAAYRDMRAIAGLQDLDIGAYMSDAITVLTRLGVCLESLWPYDTARVMDEPKAAADIDAVTRTDLRLQRVVESDPDRRADACLRHLSAGRLLWVGGPISEAYANHRGAGPLPPPKSTDRTLGGHARVIAGHQREVGGTYTAKEWGSWRASSWGTGVRAGVCLGNVDLGWCAWWQEIAVLMEVRDAA
jgi:hypothetical protein